MGRVNISAERNLSIHPVENKTMSSDKEPEFDAADAIAETLKDLPVEVKSRVMQSAVSLVEATYETLNDLPVEVRAKALQSALYLLGVEAEEQAQETRSESADKASPPTPEAWRHYVGEQLFRAVDHNDRAAAEAALKIGADIYYRHGSSESAFVAALKRGNAEMVGLFLDHGADPNAQLSHAYEYQIYDIEPLMLAVMMGHEDVVKLLLDKGAKAWQWHQFGKDDDGVGFTTPLGKAAELGFTNIVKILRDHGARDDDGYSDVGWRGGQTHTVKDWAEKHGQQEVVRLLEEKQGEKADFASPFEDDESSAAEALTVDKLRFNIAYVSEPRWYDEWSCELINGQVKFGEHIDYFTTAFTENSWSQGTYEGQWSEAVVRLLNGYDRTVFVLNFGTIDGYQTWLMWREGETVYAAFNWAHAGEFDPEHPYDNLPGYQTEKQSRREFRELSMQDIRDFFLLRGSASLETREQLGRPCAQCGAEMRRCNRCGSCLTCGGGVGNAELGHCQKCAGGDAPIAGEVK